MIAAAAIRHVDGRLFAVAAPGRHGDVIHAMVECGIVERVTSEHLQGFVTFDGRFVDREAAWRVAEELGQLLPRAPTDKRGGTLYSEDVW